MRNPNTQLPYRGIDRRQALALLAGSATALSVHSVEAQTRSEGNLGPPPGDTRATRIDAELQRLTDRVFAFIQLAGPGQSGRAVANGGLIVGPHSLMAIDTLAAPLQTQHFIETARRVTGKSFKRLVITHHHFDHTLGAQYFGEVDIIAQQECRALMLSSDTAKPVRELWSARESWAKGDEVFHRVLPNIAYRDELTFFDMGSEVRLTHLSRGHSAGDTLVHLPEEKILFAGDVAFFGITPMSASGYFADWLKAIDTILGMDVERIVPGHGPIGGKQELRAMRGYLDHIYRQGRKLFDAGVTATDAAVNIDLGDYAGWPEVQFRTRLNLLRLYAEFDGSIKP